MVSESWFFSSCPEIFTIKAVFGWDVCEVCPFAGNIPGTQPAQHTRLLPYPQPWEVAVFPATLATSQCLTHRKFPVNSS